MFVVEVNPGTGCVTFACLTRRGPGWLPAQASTVSRTASGIPTT